ncbi:expressed unknown protein [Seminavis robusta]|uniref:Uncharacterized protein n=1 Tax=Seminavis robusta TaxID=568900 RepID=A0A9N8DAK8_9STRA|nr:expressed unknown protein [Seminavis robusta]|eukprot:Sro35_g022540.1 n/a (512) ;mRNA; f:121714-123327
MRFLPTRTNKTNRRRGDENDTDGTVPPTGKRRYWCFVCGIFLLSIVTFWCNSNEVRRGVSSLSSFIYSANDPHQKGPLDVKDDMIGNLQKQIDDLQKKHQQLQQAMALRNGTALQNQATTATTTNEGATKIQSSVDASVPQESSNSNDNHWRDTSVLELLPWEHKSYEGLAQPGVTDHIAHQSCQPPKGIPRTCCLGSFSSGGAIHDRDTFICGLGMQDFPQLRQHTLQWFEDNDATISDTKCDICKIVEIVRKHNILISFLGDSMHHQVFDGLSCELHRRGYQVKVEETIFKVQHMYHQVQSNKTIHIRSPEWAEDERDAILRFHQLYRVPPRDDGVANITAEADVLVLGFGLHWHYHDRGEYVTDMSDLFSRIRQQGHIQLLVHRESSAQHFDAGGGEYSLWKGRPDGKNLSHCQPFSFSDSSAGWRELAIRKAANKSGHSFVMAGPHMPSLSSVQPELVTLPYFNFTAPHPTMHPHSGAAECTHYCSSPFIYYPLWRSLRFALDRQFG